MPRTGDKSQHVTGDTTISLARLIINFGRLSRISNLMTFFAYPAPNGFLLFPCQTNSLVERGRIASSAATDYNSFFYFLVFPVKYPFPTREKKKLRKKEKKNAACLLYRTPYPSLLRITRLDWVTSYSLFWTWAGRIVCVLTPAYASSTNLGLSCLWVMMH